LAVQVAQSKAASHHLQRASQRRVTDTMSSGRYVTPTPKRVNARPSSPTARRCARRAGPFRA